MPQQGWSDKRERQYEHIKEGYEKRGHDEDEATEIAARTVNKERARSGESDEAVARLWQQAMWLKPAAHGMDAPGLDSEDYVQPERSMSAIGG